MESRDNIPGAQAVVETFQSHYGLIVTAAMRHAPAPDMVYDVVHQVFVEFMETAMKGHWDPSRDPAPLLYKITKNTAINLWREEKRYTSATMQAIAEKLMDFPEKASMRPEAADETFEALNRCLEKLTEKSRRIVERHYWHDISLERLAGTMSVSANSLRKTVFRIRQKLRECIEQYPNRPNSDAKPSS